MISIVSRDKCCGCEACVQICPTGCISLKEDGEGFLFPQVDVKKCINCSKCDSVCPILNKIDPQPVLTCYAYRTKNEELLKRTSSGGFFSYAAEKVLANRGVVFGAAFKDRNEVEHQFIGSLEELDRLRRSKYVQSRIGTSFIDCKRFLHDGRQVLFCGTPCQIKALNLFLGKKYENLVTIDFVCHGVPSPGVFRKYLLELAEGKKQSIKNLRNINFREKGGGFAYSFSFCFADSYYRETTNENAFLKGFLSDIYLRRSCYDCSAKKHTSGADYTICDFWGVEYRMPDFPMKGMPGVNQVFIKNDNLMLFSSSVHEQAYIRDLNLKEKWVTPLWLRRSIPKTKRRRFFYNAYERETISLFNLVTRWSRLLFYERVHLFFIRVIRKIQKVIGGL